MSWFAEVLCGLLAIGCPEGQADRQDNAALAIEKWDTYTAPPPPPAAQPTITLNVAETPPPVTKIEVVAPPEEPEPEPEPAPPAVNPALEARDELLRLRRSAAKDTPRLQTWNVNSGQQEEEFSALDALALGSNSQGKILGFSSSQNQDRYEAPGLDSGLPVDNTRIITEDKPIPVVMENGLNSQIAGKVVLVVERDIFGSHGTKVLIPKFSRIVCEYGAPDHAESTRIGMSCNRILSADKRFEIFSLNSAVSDPQGYSGVTGSVDKRFWERYGTAFLLTGISTAVRVASGNINSANNQNLATSLNAGAEELSQKMGEITAKVLEETVSLKPIIRISQGSRLQLSLGNDWYISEGQKNAVQGTS